MFSCWVALYTRRTCDYPHGYCLSATQFVMDPMMGFVVVYSVLGGGCSRRPAPLPRCVVWCLFHALCGVFFIAVSFSSRPLIMVSIDPVHGRAHPDVVPLGWCLGCLSPHLGLLVFFSLCFRVRSRSTTVPRLGLSRLFLCFLPPLVCPVQ